MQNIKYCPKCKHSSTAAISFCPFDGTQLIEMQPAQNQPPQTAAAVATPPLAVSPSLPENTKNQMSPLMTGCLALFGVPTIFLIVMGIFWSRPLPENTRSENITSNSGNNANLQNTTANLTKQNSNEEANQSGKKIDKSSPAWKAGYNIGLREGRDPENPPKFSPVHFNVMVQGALGIHKPKDPVNWEAGYREGFLKGYRTP